MNSPVVLHIDSGRSFRGGQRQISLLLDRIAQYGIASILAVPSDSPVLDKLPAIDKITLSTTSLFRKLFLGELKNIIDYRGVDIIHAHDSEAHTIGIALKKAFPKIKLVVSRRVVFPPSGQFSAIFKYRRHVDKYVAVSEASAEVLKSIGVKHDTIVVIHSALDIDAILAIEKFSSRGNDFVTRYPKLVLSAGALTEEKDYSTAIKAFHRASLNHPDAGMMILGDGPLKTKLQNLIDHLQAPNILLAGHVEPMTPLMKCAHLFVLSSRSEGLNNSVTEAAVCGVPSIVSNVGGLPEIIMHSQNGFLCEPGDVDSFAQAIDTLLSDESLQRKMALNASDSVRKFDISELCQKTAELYNSLLA
ncbi:MAG: glycosyltransferase family 4 protein [candidate division Zixibacteria bacterium]|nr:glycosyltransferase family 4 protein [candidate division Zixibacteria bacterium]